MNIMEPEETMPLFLRRSLQNMNDDEEVAPSDDEYSAYERVTADDDDSEDYLVPIWSVMLLIILGSSLIVLCVMYLSYKHEWCRSKRREQKKTASSSTISAASSIDQAGKKLLLRWLSFGVAQCPQWLMTQLSVSPPCSLARFRPNGTGW